MNRVGMSGWGMDTAPSSPGIGVSPPPEGGVLPSPGLVYRLHQSW